MSETFGQRLMRLRKAAGYKKAKHFADAAGTSPEWISRLENDHGQPSADLNEVMAELLHVSTRFLLRGDEASPLARSVPTPPATGPTRPTTRTPPRQTQGGPRAQARTEDPASTAERTEFLASIENAVQVAVRGVFADVLFAAGSAVTKPTTVARRKSQRSAAD